MTISAIIASYNHAHFLLEAALAVLKQEPQPDELILIDDASTDDTRKVMEELQGKYSQIRLIANETNQGPALSYNLGFSLARGEFVIGCSADDFVMPGFLQEGLACLQRHPNLAFCCGDTFQFQGQKPYKLQPLKTLNYSEITVLDPPVVKRLFREENFAIPSHACMYRRSCLLEKGGYIAPLHSLCDWYLNVRLALSWGFAYIPHPFAAYRIADGSYARSIYKNPTYRKKVLDHLLILIEKEGSENLFKECRLFSQFNYRFFFDFLFRPQLWKMTLPSFPKKLKWLILPRLQKWYS